MTLTTSGRKMMAKMMGEKMGVVKEANMDKKKMVMDAMKKRVKK